MLDGVTQFDDERISKVDLSYPVIVQQLSRGLGRYVTLDGFHRVVRAASEGHTTIKAIVVDDALIAKLTHQTLSNEGLITIDEARERAQIECDAEGIDPTLSSAERCTRLIDIQQGSPLMQEERERKAAYAESPNWNRFKAHSMRVIKELPPSIEERQAADKFHRDLKAKLGQTDRVPAMEKFNSKNLFSMSISNEAVARDPLWQQLLDADCYSTSIAVAVREHPVEGKVLADLYTKLNDLSKGDGKRESAYDAYCNTWYGEDEDDKLKLIKDTTKALKALEKTFK